MCLVLFLLLSVFIMHVLRASFCQNIAVKHTLQFFIAFSLDFFSPSRQRTQLCLWMFWGFSKRALHATSKHSNNVNKGYMISDILSLANRNVTTTCLPRPILVCRSSFSVIGNINPSSALTVTCRLDVRQWILSVDTLSTEWKQQKKGNVVKILVLSSM